MIASMVPPNPEETVSGRSRRIGDEHKPSMHHHVVLAHRALLASFVFVVALGGMRLAMKWNHASKSVTVGSTNAGSP